MGRVPVKRKGADSRLRFAVEQLSTGNMKLKVCIGSACHLKGSYDVINALNNLIDERDLEDDVELAGVFCLGHCVDAVSVQIGDDVYSVSAQSVPEFFDEHVVPAIS